MTELGIRHMTTGREADAIEWLTRASAVGSGDARIALAYLATHVGNDEEAASWLAKATGANCDPLLMASFALLAGTAPGSDVGDDWLRIAASVSEPQLAEALCRIANR